MQFRFQIGWSRCCMNYLDTIVSVVALELLETSSPSLAYVICYIKNQLYAHLPEYGSLVHLNINEIFYCTCSGVHFKMFITLLFYNQILYNLAKYLLFIRDYLHTKFHISKFRHFWFMLKGFFFSFTKEKRRKVSGFFPLWQKSERVEHIILEFKKTKK